MMNTVAGSCVEKELFCSYSKHLVNRFFKILPIKESGEESIAIYLEGLRDEIDGLRSFVKELNVDYNILSLLSILQFMIDNPNCDTEVVRRYVFHAISLCNKMDKKYRPDSR